MITATEYIGSVGVGVTSPQFFRADDGKIYIVKLQNNRLGSKVLVNEFVAAKFGNFMGLCFPTSGLIEINKQTLQKSQDIITSDISLGRHFASQYIDNVEYIGKHNLYKAVNITEMAGVILFDHMFHNADRTINRKNLLLRQEDDGYKIYAIDNSHLFRSGQWTLESLNSLSTKIKTYYRYSFGLLLRDCLSPQDFLPYLEKTRGISNDHIDTLVEEIPDEWLPDESERQAMAQYIKIRRDMAEEIWENLCKFIPKACGGHLCLQGRIIGSHKKKLSQF